MRKALLKGFNRPERAPRPEPVPPLSLLKTSCTCAHIRLPSLFFLRLFRQGQATFFRFALGLHRCMHPCLWAGELVYHKQDHVPTDKKCQSPSNDRYSSTALFQRRTAILYGV